MWSKCGAAAMTSVREAQALDPVKSTEVGTRDGIETTESEKESVDAKTQPAMASKQYNKAVKKFARPPHLRFCTYH